MYNYTFVYYNLLATKSDEVYEYQSQDIQHDSNTDKIGNKGKFVGLKEPPVLVEYGIEEDQMV